jgi:hypothetical protein
VRSDWINRHSLSVNDSLPGLSFIHQKLLADEFVKGKGELADGFSTRSGGMSLARRFNAG